MNNTARLSTIDRLLDGIPPFKCLEGCHDCCGPVVMSRLELVRIAKRVGKSPDELMGQMVKATEAGCSDSEVSSLACKCPLLGESGCTVYDIRPAICRVFGSSNHPRLVCPHGVGPKHPISATATDALIDSVMQLGY